MIAVERTVLVLLAAGRSARFGAGDSKLDADFLGRPLGLHATVALEALPFPARLAVTGRAVLDYAPHGYRVLPNPDPAGSMASSVRIGVAAAQGAGADAVLIALADMPRITAAHVMRLFDAAAPGDAVIASSDGRDPKPPALFPAAVFDALLALDGDRGARDLIRAGRHVVASSGELIDVDTVEQLAALRELVRT